MKRCAITLILVLTVGILFAQNISVGVQNGITLSSVSFKYDDSFQYQSYSIGLFTEYTPKDAFFSLTSELHYLFDENMLMIPLSINFFIGNRVRPKVMGGLVPVIRFNPEYPNVVFGIGASYGFGLDILVTDKFTILSHLVWYRLPYKSTYRYDTVNLNWDNRVMIKLGLGYTIR